MRVERPSESTLAYSAETLLFSMIASRLYHVGEPVDVRAGLLSKKHVDAIISSVRLEMDEIKKANKVWREAGIVTKAAPGRAGAETLKSRHRDPDRTLSRDEPLPANAAAAKSVLTAATASRRRRRRTRRVRYPEKGIQLAEEPELTSQEPCLDGHLVPNRQPTGNAFDLLAKSQGFERQLIKSKRFAVRFV